MEVDRKKVNVVFRVDSILPNKNSSNCGNRVGDLHVHVLRHTVGLRLREADVADRTQDAILWHSNRTMTAHYSMAQLVEIFEALELIKDESHRWNVSLQSLVRDAAANKLTRSLPAPKKNGLALLALTH